MKQLTSKTKTFLATVMLCAMALPNAASARVCNILVPYPLFDSATRAVAQGQSIPREVADATRTCACDPQEAAIRQARLSANCRLARVGGDVPKERLEVWIHSFSPFGRMPMRSPLGVSECPLYSRAAWECPKATQGGGVINRAGTTPGGTVSPTKITLGGSRGGVSGTAGGGDGGLIDDKALDIIRARSQLCGSGGWFEPGANGQVCTGTF
jgi:hypothetical protein